MHDIKFIRKNPEKFQKQMYRRGLNIDISSILEIDEAIRKQQALNYAAKWVCLALIAREQNLEMEQIIRALSG